MKLTSSYVKSSGPRMIRSVLYDFSLTRAWDATAAMSSVETNGIFPVFVAEYILRSFLIVGRCCACEKFS
jgi:hypothetical protein